MDQERFLAFVDGRRWRVARSSPHSYTIKNWCDDRQEFYAAVRTVYEQGEPGVWNGHQFVYYRPGDGYRYWTYWNGSEDTLHEIVAFNRAKESGQLRLFG